MFLKEEEILLMINALIGEYGRSVLNKHTLQGELFDKLSRAFLAFYRAQKLSQEEDELLLKELEKTFMEKRKES
jgi:hypothetical protein